MPEVSVPPLVPTAVPGTVADYPRRWARTQPDRVMLSVRTAPGTWQEVTAAELQRRIDTLAKGLLAAGIEAGDRVGLMSRTRWEWTLTDLALWTVGAVPVPIYETSSRDQVRWICEDSGAVAVVVEDAAMTATVSRARDGLDALRDVWQIEAGALDELAVAGAEVPDEELARRREELDRGDLATIIYTSGTTGRPKGCEITHDNLMSLVENATERLAEIVDAPGAANLVFLPLAHVFARFIEVVCLHSGVRMGHTPDASSVLEDLADFRPTFLLAVPRIFEKIHTSAEQTAARGGTARLRLFRWATGVAEDYSRALDRGTVGPALRVRHAVADRLVLARLRSALGGRVDYAISGGAALGERLGHVFRGTGLVVLEGYGLTETTAPATVNTPDMMRIGTVGRPLPGTAVRIEDTGEILVRGVGVFRGYRGDEEATRAAMVDGWLRTGDLGELDDDGFLRITGRLKDLIVTAGGKNVSPGPLEDVVRAHPLVSQCVVVGEGRPFVAALVTLDEQVLPGWLETHGLTGLPPEEVVGHPRVREELQQAVDTANAGVSRAESIRSFVVLPEDLSVASGLLTPSLKVRRSRVVEELAGQIEAIYSRR
ncbi:Long-chain-fatty-acid--CoA ligase [Serinicoccus hydrothermalis]|uniref:Acyl-CoA synthetase n=1 Tax=Serinicoccus hydrothermalis TaxID=1758689 RepID=A0A1B1N9V1_9MICO|nr:AMP-dependent synthetase/ligase [Serinicoccus hydrothermalis]ANS78212.1 Long-chain-fatty-acid--CoA ligase [Serinicoccus hydrothermalis]